MVNYYCGLAAASGLKKSAGGATMGLIRRAFHSNLRRYGAQKSEEVKEIKGIPYSQLTIGKNTEDAVGKAIVAEHLSKIFS